MSIWSDEELEATAIAYIDIFEKEKRGQKTIKKRVYDDLSVKYGRTPKSYGNDSHPPSKN